MYLVIKPVYYQDFEYEDGIITFINKDISNNKSYVIKYTNNKNIAKNKEIKLVSIEKIEEKTIEKILKTKEDIFLINYNSIMNNNITYSYYLIYIDAVQKYNPKIKDIVKKISFNIKLRLAYKGIPYEEL